MQERLDIHKEEQDVVVVGAGAAGLPAAMAARELGARTTVLEWAPNLKESNLARAGGGIIRAPELDVRNTYDKIPVEERVRIAVEAGEGQCNPELVKIVMENVDAGAAWLEKLGFAWAEHDKMSVRSLRVAKGRGSMARGLGFGFNNQMRKMAENMGCRVLFNARGEKLLTDIKGRVIGVRAMTEEGLKDLKSGAVVLATSGFQANQEMLMRYHSGDVVRRIRLTGSPYSTGSGHRMVEEVGAKLIDMDQLEFRTIDKTWRPGSPGQMGTFRHLSVIARYGIIVNKLGRRFVDENEENDPLGGSIMMQPGAASAWIMDQKARQIAREQVSPDEPDEIERYERTRPGVVMTAHTLEEVAAKAEVPYHELKKTIDEYNDAVDRGKTLVLDVPKDGCAIRVDTPPFYVVYPVWGGLNCTLGGPQTTVKAEVVNHLDKPIPGLYAAGEMVGGFYHGSWKTTPGGAIYRKSNVFIAGALLSMCLVFGRIAGENAARFAVSRAQ